MDETGPAGLKQVKHISKALIEEMSGILKSMVQACLSWQKHRLDNTPDIIEATQEYREESDFNARFIMGSCERNAEAKTKSRDLYAAMESFCEDPGDDVQRKKTTGLSLKLAGFNSTGKSPRYHHGLRLIKHAPAQTMSETPARGYDSYDCLGFSRKYGIGKTTSRHRSNRRIDRPRHTIICCMSFFQYFAHCIITGDTFRLSI